MKKKELDKYVADLEYIQDKAWFDEQFDKANVLLAIWECIGCFERMRNQSCQSFKKELRDQASAAAGYVRIAHWLFADEDLKTLSGELEKQLHLAWFYSLYQIGPLRTVCVKIRRHVLDMWIEYINRKKDFAEAVAEHIEFFRNSPMYPSE